MTTRDDAGELPGFAGCVRMESAPPAALSPTDTTTSAKRKVKTFFVAMEYPLPLIGRALTGAFLDTPETRCYHRHRWRSAKNEQHQAFSKSRPMRAVLSRC